MSRVTSDPSNRPGLLDAAAPLQDHRPSLRLRRGLIRFGAAAVAAGLIALVVPGTAAPQFGNIVVDTTADGNDGECARDCTLREAIALADQSQGQFVSLRPGVYRLTLGPLVLTNDTVFGVSFSGNNSAGARSTIIDARGSGRAIEVPAGSTSVLAGVTIRGGNAASGGAAFVAAGGQLSLYAAIVKDNVASGRGGGVANSGNFTAFSTTFNGNRAAAGGAISSEAASNTFIYTSTLSGNTASGNGGAIVASATVALQRTTLARNTAAQGGGFFDESGAVQQMLGTLLAGNSGGSCAGFTSNRTQWITNLSDDSSCAFDPGQGTNGSDPQIGALANNGGPTDTHALSQGSPAINGVDPSFCPAGTPDQRNAPAPDTCDIGSYEFGARVPPSQLPPPEAGETVNVSEARGIVKIKLPGSDEFFDLEDAQQVPVGSTFDTSKGRVNLIAAGQQRSWFYQGVFKLGQGKGARPLSTLSLTGRLACGRSANIAAKRKRRLWGDGKGKFRTKGKHSAATVVGTRWLVEDRCNGTLTKVVKGKVRVRDFRARRTVVVRAGKQYFARAR
jgi:CSLREA domain-containing protein